MSECDWVSNGNMTLHIICIPGSLLSSIFPMLCSSSPQIKQLSLLPSFSMIFLPQIQWSWTKLVKLWDLLSLPSNCGCQALCLTVGNLPYTGLRSKFSKNRTSSIFHNSFLSIVLISIELWCKISFKEKKKLWIIAKY